MTLPSLPVLSVGRRLSVKGYRLTIRYVGPVDGKAGQWLGVEWDDPQRGKHDGTFQNRRYFECLSSSPTAASFIRLDQPWDQTKTFSEALANKYMTEHVSRPLHISGKEVQQVGFDKFSRRQAELRGIQTVVLDRMNIVYQINDEAENERISSKCSHIIDLDISSNLFQSLEEVVSLANQFPKLQSLTLDGNRFTVDIHHQYSLAPDSIRNLSLSDTLQPWTICASTVCSTFPNLQTFAAERNEWTQLELAPLPQLLHTLKLDNNQFQSLAAIQILNHEPLRTINLKYNNIHTVGDVVTNRIGRLDLGYNAIDDMAFFDALTLSFPHLKHLRVTGNPVFASLKNSHGQSHTADEAFMLTLARLPHLETLNFSAILPKERLDAEVFYLGQIAAELRLTPPARRATIFDRHARWRVLCEEYGEPDISYVDQNAEEYPVHVLGAHLMRITFRFLNNLHDDKTTFPISWSQELPKSWSIYTLLGILGRRLGVMPLDLRLVWETDERDPVRASGTHSMPKWWDSEDEDENQALSGHDEAFDKEQWIAREVELSAGTQSLGTYIDGRTATVRIEIVGDSLARM